MVFGFRVLGLRLLGVSGLCSVHQQHGFALPCAKMQEPKSEPTLSPKPQTYNMVMTYKVKLPKP